MGQLLEYVRNSTEIGDLQTLAFRSGVDYQLLAMLDEGSVTLGSHYVDILIEVLGSDVQSILDGSGSVEKLQSVTSRKGAPPIGYDLIVVEAGSVIPGDMISYVPPSSVIGSIWVSIDDIQIRKLRSHFYVDFSSNGDKLISITRTQIIRIARRAASKTLGNGNGKDGKEGFEG